jgi:pimeloyl-ACP methyl ester carboxylesterase
MRQTLPALAGIALSLIACVDRAPVGPTGPSDARFQKTSVATPASGPWATVVEGRTGPGSLYALYVPRAWNGDAVYYAHGVRPPLAPITLDDQDNFFEVRDALGALGYAFAYSSFSENGLAIKDGAQRTHQLRGLLASTIGRPPRRNYLAGYSLGALVALQMAERFPGQYDGALTMCGMVGGTPLQVQYIGDVRALFDWFYPGVLPGDVNAVPPTPPTRDEVWPPCRRTRWVSSRSRARGRRRSRTCRSATSPTRRAPRSRRSSARSSPRSTTSSSRPTTCASTHRATRRTPTATRRTRSARRCCRSRRRTSRN